MNEEQALVIIIKSSEISIDIANRALKYFNEPEWPGLIENILETAASLARIHRDCPKSTVANDYANLASILGQIIWPTPESISDSDDRLYKLRGALGNLRIDIDAILSASQNLGLVPDNLSLLSSRQEALIDKKGKSNLLQGIISRLNSVEELVVLDVRVEANPSVSGRQSSIVNHYIKRMKSNIDIARIALSVGPLVDLNILERASIAMAEATFQLVATVNTAVSKATEGLRVAARRISIPIRRLIKGVGTLVRVVAREDAHRVNDNVGPIPETDEGKIEVPQATTPLEPTAGLLLQEARERSEYDLDSIAGMTRIPIRYLKALEKSKYGIFTSQAHLIGFARTFARIVKADEVRVVRLIRLELNDAPYHDFNQYWINMD